VEGNSHTALLARLIITCIHKVSPKFDQSLFDLWHISFLWGLDIASSTVLSGVVLKRVFLWASLDFLTAALN